MGGFSFLPFGVPSGPGDVAEYIPPETSSSLGPIAPLVNTPGPDFSLFPGNIPASRNTYESPPVVPMSTNTFGGLMPFFNDLLNARGNLFGAIVGAGLDVAGRFLPQAQPLPGTPSPPPIVGVPGLPGPIVENSPADVYVMRDATGGCGVTRGSAGWLNSNVPRCLISGKTANSPKRRGVWRVGQTGKLVCCPVRRRMNPCNGHALRRAARRLQGFARMEKRIHKALAKACGPAGRRAARSYTRSRKSSCKTCG